ncbi:hypothetical protein GQ42DRAFT_33788 [Ramicandelaber brevisporus]|nr:hypothetical protein GQ42DRAFT_33788 [Ramicandelaber brevisporus]
MSTPGSSSLNFGPAWMRSAPQSQKQTTAAPQQQQQQQQQQQPPSAGSAAAAAAAAVAAATTASSRPAPVSYSAIAAASSSSSFSPNSNTAESGGGVSLMSQLFPKMAGANTNTNSGLDAKAVEEAMMMNPFSYSREFMLGMYNKEIKAPIDFIHYDNITTNDNIDPLGESALDENESKLFIGPFNSDSLLKRRRDPATQAIATVLSAAADAHAHSLEQQQQQQQQAAAAMAASVPGSGGGPHSPNHMQYGSVVSSIPHMPSWVGSSTNTATGQGGRASGGGGSGGGGRGSIGGGSGEGRIRQPRDQREERSSMGGGRSMLPSRRQNEWTGSSTSLSNEKVQIGSFGPDGQFQLPDGADDLLGGELEPPSANTNTNVNSASSQKAVGESTSDMNWRSRKPQSTATAATTAAHANASITSAVAQSSSTDALHRPSYISALAANLGGAQQRRAAEAAATTTATDSIAATATAATTAGLTGSSLAAAVSSAVTGLAPHSHQATHVVPPSSRWIYRDPSGNMQGPFSSEEMHAWFVQGFFPDTLLVGRENDNSLVPISRLVENAGGVVERVFLEPLVQPPPPHLPHGESASSSNIDNSGGSSNIPAPSAVYLSFQQQDLQLQQDMAMIEHQVAQLDAQLYGFNPDAELNNLRNLAAIHGEHHPSIVALYQQFTQKYELYMVRGNLIERFGQVMKQRDQLSSLMLEEQNRIIEHHQRTLLLSQQIQAQLEHTHLDNTHHNITNAVTGAEEAAEQPFANVTTVFEEETPVGIASEPTSVAAIAVADAATAISTAADAVTVEKEEEPATAVVASEPEIKESEPEPTPVVDETVAETEEESPVETAKPEPKVASPVKAAPAPATTIAPAADKETAKSKTAWTKKATKDAATAASATAEQPKAQAKQAKAAEPAPAEPTPEKKTTKAATATSTVPASAQAPAQAPAQPTERTASPWQKVQPAGVTRAKTLIEIQREEEARRREITEQQRASQMQITGSSGYAAIAAANNRSGAAWGSGATSSGSTVIVRTSPSPAPPQPPTQTVTILPSASAAAAASSTTASSDPTPATAAAAIARRNTQQQQQQQASLGPFAGRKESTDFIGWARRQLNGRITTGISVDEFLSMLLDFEVDAAPSTIEIITEMVHSSSTTLPSRRFADEFVARRKVDLGRMPVSGLNRFANLPTIDQLVDNVANSSAHKSSNNSGFTPVASSSAASAGAASSSSNASSFQSVGGGKKSSRRGGRV